MNFRRRKSAGSRALLTICGIFVLALFFLLAAPVRLRGAALGLFAPAWRAHGSGDTIFSRTAEFFKSKNALVAENEKLNQDLAEARALLSDRDALYQENLGLKDRLGRLGAPNVVLASVLVRPPQTPYDTLIIDAGSAEGIAVGDKVAAEGTLLIGKVSEVEGHTAVVSLYSSPGNVFDGFLRGTIPVSVEAQGGGSLRAQVPYDAQAVEGDPVSIPGIEANTAFIVEHVETVPGDSTVLVYMRLPVAASGLSKVDVWVDKK